MMFLVANSQALTQVVRGKVIDIDTKQPLIGASVVIVDSNPFKGTTTNFDGEFIIEDVAVGRMAQRNQSKARRSNAESNV